MDFQEDFSGNIGFIGFYCFLQGVLLVLLIFMCFPKLFDGFLRKLLVSRRFWLVFKENVDLSEVLC